jgi:hypothetical protein
MELILVALERVMFAAVVVATVLSILAADTTQSLPPRSRFRAVVLSAQNDTANIQKPIVSCKNPSRL